jgi:hypothetical protein
MGTTGVKLVLKQIAKRHNARASGVNQIGCVFCSTASTTQKPNAYR